MGSPSVSTTAGHNNAYIRRKVGPDDGEATESPGDESDDGGGEATSSSATALGSTHSCGTHTVIL